MFRALKRSDGFSMVELAIILTIIGLVTAVVLQTYRYYIQNKTWSTSETSSADIYSAMSNHLFNFGDLPCPASPLLPAGDSRAGKAAGTSDYTQCKTWVNANIGNIPGPNTPYCEANTSSSQYGLCLVYGQRTTTYGNTQHPGVKDVVLTGSIPYVDLGLTIKQSMDGWGNKMIYAVSFYETQQDVVLAQGRENLGSINIQTYTRSNETQVPAQPVWGRSDWGGGGPVPNNYMYVAFSAGLNGKGAYSADGKLVAPCTGQGYDIENCNGDATFNLSGTGSNDAVYSTAPGAYYYDDMGMIYDVNLDRDKWSYTSTTSMQNKTSGSVIMGAQSVTSKMPSAVLPQIASQKYKLDVNGDAIADTIDSNYICDSTGANCFPIGLLNSDCNGQFITGIANGKLICYNAVDTTKISGSKSCTGTDKLVGFQATGKGAGSPMKLQCRP